MVNLIILLLSYFVNKESVWLAQKLLLANNCKYLQRGLEIKIFYITIIVIVKEENMACGSLEIEILNTFWSILEIDEDCDISIQDVVDELSQNGVERAYTTIKTVMDRLVGKSILVRYKVGKKFFYKVAVDKEEMALDMLREYTDNFFNGDYVKMCRFVENKTEELLVK